MTLPSRILLFNLFFLLLHSGAEAQSQRLISGTVTDASSNAPLPFISVSLKNLFIGTSTNEQGAFDFYLPADAATDTLVINSLGYTTIFIPVSTIDKKISIALKSNLIELKEVIIRPLSPTDYIRLAMRRVKDNYPNKPFETEAYYRKKTLENQGIINFDEGIFKTYYPNYQDTVPNQHQLELFQKAQEKEIAFMKEKRDAKKKNEKDDDKQKVNLANSFAGPETILSLDVMKSKDEFLDTLNLKEFSYEFGPPSTYQGKELLCILFKSRGKVEHVRSEGKIYIELNSSAIVNVEYQGEFIVPLMYRPLLFMLGYGIENPTFTKKVDYQEVNDKWYPKNLQFFVRVQLTKKYMFKTNEHSDISIEGIFTVNKIKVSKPAEIPLAKRFDPKKKMEEQVHNDDGLTWSGMNMIKR